MSEIASVDVEDKKGYKATLYTALGFVSASLCVCRKPPPPPPAASFRDTQYIPHLTSWEWLLPQLES